MCNTPTSVANEEFRNYTWLCPKLYISNKITHVKAKKEALIE